MSAKRHDEKGLAGGEKGKEKEEVMAQVVGAAEGIKQTRTWVQPHQRYPYGS